MGCGVATNLYGGRTTNSHLNQNRWIIDLNDVSEEKQLFRFQNVFR